MVSVRGPTSHAGLWFDKFCPWKRMADSGEIVPAKLDCVGEAAARPAGDGELLAEHIQRREALLALNGGVAGCVRTASRTVTGLGYRHPIENGFAWHPVLGTPYLPGSGLKGVARAWAELCGEPVEDIRRIFGPRPGGGSRGGPEEEREHRAGSVVFLEAIPRRPVRLVPEVMTPHYGPYYQGGEAPADYHSPNPIPFLAVERHVSFLAGVLPRGGGRGERAIEEEAERAAADVRRAHAWLLEALTEIGAGAKTAAGYGRFEEEPAEMRRWEQAAAALRASSGLSTPIERMRELVKKLSERQLYEHVGRYLEKGELTEVAERAAFCQAARETPYFASWERGQPADPRERPAGDKKLKQAAALLANRA